MVTIVSNVLIYRHVSSSSNRVQSPAISTAGHRRGVSRRDIFLLRHMAIMFGIFVAGWTPSFLIPIVEKYTPVHSIVSSSLNLWSELAVLINMIDLFLYNHEVRRYLTGLRLPCCS